MLDLDGIVWRDLRVCTSPTVLDARHSAPLVAVAFPASLNYRPVVWWVGWDSNPTIPRLKVECLRHTSPLGYQPIYGLCWRSSLVEQGEEQPTTCLEESNGVEPSPCRHDGPGFKSGCVPLRPTLRIHWHLSQLVFPWIYTRWFTNSTLVFESGGRCQTRTDTPLSGATISLAKRSLT